MLCAAAKREAWVALFFDLKRMMRIDGARSPRAAYSLWVHRLGLHHPHVVPPWFALLYSLSRYPAPVIMACVGYRGAGQKKKAPPRRGGDRI